MQPLSDKLLERIHEPLWRRVFFNWEHALERLFPLGGTSQSNEVHLLIEGDAIFSAMEEAIHHAQKQVWLETYFLEPDSIGTRIRNALVQAAHRGCDVILIFDHLGSPRVSSSFLSPLWAAGGKSFAFNPIWPWRCHGPLLFRDHRKILLIDNHIGFCGSVNISTDYAGKRLGSNRFRDTVIQIKGPAVQDLSNLFLTSLRETSGEDRDTTYEGPIYQKGVLAQVLGSNSRRNLYSIQNSMKVTLKRATQSCYLTSPYFLPYDNLRKSMLQAAKRGVDIRVLTAGLSDVPLMRLASQHVYEQFLKAGIRIYEMFGKTLHAKTATIDGIFGSVGSYNLDHWSARRNLEVNVSVIDPKIANELQDQFIDDLKNAKEVTLQDLEKRSRFTKLLQWLAYQIMRL